MTMDTVVPGKRGLLVGLVELVIGDPYYGRDWKENMGKSPPGTSEVNPWAGSKGLDPGRRSRRQSGRRSGKWGP